MLDKTSLLAAVNLEGYSASEGWIGFYEARSLATCSAQDVVDSFGELFLAEVSAVEIATSLYYDCDIRETASFRQLDYETLRDRVTSLLEKDVLRLKNLYWKDNNYESADYEVYLENLEKDFRIITHPSREFIQESVMSLISLEGTSGHCFLFHPEYHLLSYPHDDRGFGFIFLDSASDEQKRAVKLILERLNDRFRWVPVDLVKSGKWRDLMLAGRVSEELSTKDIESLL